MTVMAGGLLLFRRADFKLDHPRYTPNGEASMVKLKITESDVSTGDEPLTENDLRQSQQIYGEILRRLKKRRHGFPPRVITELHDVSQKCRKALLEDNADGHLPEALVEKDLRLWDEIDAALAVIRRRG